MKRKDYQKPTMKVVKLQHQCHILSGSAQGQEVGVQSYDWNDEGTATANWLNGVATNGTFIKPLTLSEETGLGKIPSEWTIVNKGGTRGLLSLRANNVLNVENSSSS